MIQEQCAALNAKDPARLQATFTDDSVKMEEGIPMIKGKAEIVKGVAEGMSKGLFSDMQGKTLESVISGDLGYATYSGSHLDAKGVKQTWHGVSIFKRVGRGPSVACARSTCNKVNATAVSTTSSTT